MRTYKQLFFEINEQERPTIMLDLDSVLVDYLKGIKDLTGMSLDEWRARAKKMKDLKGNIPPEVSGNRMHKIILDAGVKFWAELDWMRDGKKLWNFIKKYDVEILSAYNRPKKGGDMKGVSKEGKLLWLNKHVGLPIDKINLVYRENKMLYAQNKEGKPNLLIDDYEKNTKAFKAAGGLAIRHTSASSTISQLKRMGF